MTTKRFLASARSISTLTAGLALLGAVATTSAQAAVGSVTPTGSYVPASAQGLTSSSDDQLRAVLDQAARRIDTQQTASADAGGAALQQRLADGQAQPANPAAAAGAFGSSLASPQRPGSSPQSGWAAPDQFGAHATRVVFADWTAADAAADTATGTLGGRAISLTGSELQVGITDGSFTGFAQPYFAFPIARGDALALGSQPGYSYEIRLGAPVTDPVLQIASLASRIDFPAGTNVVRLAGQSAFVVSGSALIGAASGSGANSDANGTAQLKGTFTTIRFTAVPTPDAPNGDGFYLQLGA